MVKWYDDASAEAEAEFDALPLPFPLPLKLVTRLAQWALAKIDAFRKNSSGKEHKTESSLLRRRSDWGNTNKSFV